MMRLIFLIFSTIFFIQCNSEKTITVLGRAEMELPVDFIIVSCNISVSGKDKTKINDKSTIIALKIQDELTKFNIKQDQLITMKSDISRNYYRDESKYSSTINYKFPLKSLNKYDELKKVLLKANATEINVLEKHILKEDSLRAVVYQEAIRKARKKAELFLSPMDSKIIGITKILDNNYNLDENIEEVFNIENTSLYQTVHVPPTAQGSYSFEKPKSPTTKLTKIVEASIAIQFAYE